MLSSVTLKCEDTQLADVHYCQKFLDFSQELKKKKKTLHVLYKIQCQCQSAQEQWLCFKFNQI